MYSSEDKAVPRRRRTASFSSSLLDAIYRSIDDSNSEQERKTTTTKKKQSKNDSSNQPGKRQEDKELDSNLRRAMMIESWVEKQSASQISSSSSSSESLWSSSETESRQNKPKPEPSPKPCNGFSKTRLRAMKLYGELKRAKPPISPGRRIASFLSSIFSPGGVKKPKMCYVGAADDVATPPTSRPCLVVKPQPPPRANGGDKRSVRFYPVSVVLGEDSKPCGHKRNDDLCLMASSDMRSFLEKKIASRFDHDHDHRRHDDDDDESCSSSDLFEIDHLVGVGLRYYREELPVYGTTSLKTNQAIANGFI